MLAVYVCVFCVRDYLLSLRGGIEKRDCLGWVLAGSWVGVVDTTGSYTTITLTDSEYNI